MAASVAAWATEWDQPDLKLPSAKEATDALFTCAPIVWSRLADFQDVCMRQIGERLISASLGDALTPRTPRALTHTSDHSTRYGEDYQQVAYMMNEIGSRVQAEKITLPLSDGSMFTIYASAANLGAEELAEELHALCESMTFTTDPDELDRADHFLVRLNEATWTSEEASVILAKEVMDAMRLGVHCLLMHEVLGARWCDNERRGACAFEHFFMDHSTPKVLIKAGLYNEIAMNVAGDEYRKVGLLKTIEQLAKDVGERQPLSEELMAMLEEEFGTSQREPTSFTKKRSQPANVATSAATWMLDKAAAAATATTAAAATATAAAGAAGAFALRASRGSVDDSRFSRRLSSSPNSPG
jgi:hypothetical protein